MDRSFPGLLTTALIVCVAVVPVATSVQAGAAVAGVPAERSVPAQQTDATGVETGASNETTPTGTDDVLLDVRLAENGSAAWRVEYRTRLDDRADRERFRRLRASLANGSANESGGFHDRIRATVAAAESATGREMAASNFDVRTSVRRIPREYGVVVYGFRWQGFATETERGLRAGDALDGFFLSSGERLVVSWPEGYELDDVEPAPDAQRERTVVWRGPTTFGAGGPRIDVAEGPGPVARLAPFGAAIAAVALVAAGLARRRDVGRSLAALRARVLDDGDEASHLLSNEERVIRLLEERGGRVKQQAVADELGWTETKTSYVVSNLREKQWIRSFRVGRENVLSLADSFDASQSEP